MSRGERIEAALFDFGGVFTDIALRRRRGARAPSSARRPGRLLELVFGPYHADTDHPWHRLERGEIAFREARDAIIALGRAAGIDADPLRVFQKMGAGGGRARGDGRARAAAARARAYAPPSSPTTRASSASAGAR